MTEWQPGHVYILVNTSMPGLIKIGLTTRDPETRAKELSRSTGVPTPFEVAYSRWVPDCVEVEKAVHAELDQYRVGANREFFQMPVAQAKKAIEVIAKRYEPREVKYRELWVWPAWIRPRLFVQLAAVALLIAVVYIAISLPSVGEQRQAAQGGLYPLPLIRTVVVNSGS